MFCNTIVVINKFLIVNKLKIKIKKVFEFTEESSFVMYESTRIKPTLCGIVRYNGRLAQRKVLYVRKENKT